MRADRKLAKRLVAGDQTALAELYDRLAGRVFALAVSIVRDRADAEEVVSDAFLHVWRKADEFSPDRGSLDAWVVTIARSRALDRVRGVRRRERLREEGEHKIASFTMPEARADPAAAAEARVTMRRTVGPALASLAEEQRRVIELAYLGGMTQSEIAEELNVPLGTVKTRIRAGMRTLRATLADPGVPDRVEPAGPGAVR